MSEQTQGAAPAAAPPRPNSARMIASLAGVAALSGLLVVLAFQLTRPVIEAKKAVALRRAVFNVIPAAETVVTFRLNEQGRAVPVESDKAPGARIYAGYEAGGDLAGVALEAEGKGYQDVIKVLYGYVPREEAIVGFSVLESKETPGLGDKIGKDPQFLSHFEHLDVRLDAEGTGLAHEIEVLKSGADEPWQIDAITGATISSEAVGDLLNRSAAQRLPLVQRNLERLEAGK